MRVGSKSGRTMIAITVLSLLTAACGGGTASNAPAASASAAASSAATAAPSTAGESPAAAGKVTVCELAYYTGSFAPYGAALTNDVRFPIEEVINLDPPLGRTWELISEDIGDDKEAQAAKICIEQHQAEILVSIAHQYRTYREYMMEQWQENDSPIGPSVHGGAIPGNLGGKAAEPIFRAQGLDQALGTYGSLYSQSIGAKNIVIFATQVEGFQLAADAAEKAAGILGLNVLARLDVQPTQPSYRAEAQKIADLKPDAVIVQAGSTESAAIIKGAAEAGLSLNWVGETGWAEAEFIGTLGTAPIASQKGIGFPAFAPNTTTPAWEFFQPLWDAQADKAYDATGQYAFSTYDLMVQTALAVEAAGSYKASAWAPAMFEVGEGGEVCYTYADCLKLIREGKDVDYEGVTGPGLYTDGGVNAVTPAYIPFTADGKTGAPVLLDAAKGLELIDAIKTEAVCDPTDPPNECEW
ncbi:MAG TPA: ABC transporter substrate-binding protein [Candidatus Limnocylindrales bacterium]|nr:ABC transporter substrate-binding protein [Candidatus Limnocylindrales bacterium]